MKKNRKILSYIGICILTIFLFIIKLRGYEQGKFDIYIQGILIFTFLLLLGIIFFKKQISKKTKICIGLICLAVFVSYPLYNDYLIHSHDIGFHLIRIEGIKNALKNFEIPVRIYSLVNNGYGYAISMFYPELFIYIPSILRLLNTSLVFSYKILIFLINLGSIFSMYIAVKNISKSRSTGIIGAIVYATASYRLVTVFTRGAIGEAIAIAFLPIVIWGLYEICTGNKKRWYILLIGYTGVIQSHILSIITTAMISIAFTIYFIKQIMKQKRYKQIILAIVTTILINLWFIVPFLEGYNLDLSVKNRFGESYMFSNNNVIPAELFNVFDNISSNRIDEDISNGMSEDMCFSLGLLCTIGLIINIVFCVKNKDSSDKNIKFIKFLTFLGIIFLILSTSIVPWKELEDNFGIIKKLSATMQFAWRFLGPATAMITMAMSIIIGKYVDSKYDENRDFIKNYEIVIGTAIVAFISLIIIVQPFSKEEKFEPNEIELSTSVVPYYEYYLEKTNTSSFIKDKYFTSSTNIYVNSFSKDDSKIELKYTNNEGNGYIEVPLLYYPGYVAKDEKGKKLKVVCGNNNVIRVELTEKKSGAITVDYREKVKWIFADSISLITILSLIVVAIMKRKKSKALLKKTEKCNIIHP